MPYTPFIHPDSGTIAWRFTPYSPVPAPALTFNSPITFDSTISINPTFTFSDGHTIAELDALYSQVWPENYWIEYLLANGASQADIDAQLESKIPASPVTEQEPLA